MMRRLRATSSSTDGIFRKRYSPLTQINKQNVSKLVPLWAYSLTDNRGGEGFRSSRTA